MYSLCRQNMLFSAVMETPAFWWNVFCKEQYMFCKEQNMFSLEKVTCCFLRRWRHEHFRECCCGYVMLLSLVRELYHLCMSYVTHTGAMLRMNRSCPVCIKEHFIKPREKERERKRERECVCKCACACVCSRVSLCVCVCVCV